MTRKLLWPVLVIGLALIVVPFAISMPGKMSAGQTMLNQFHSFMQPASVNTTVYYYHSTFAPLRPVAQGGIVAGREEPKLVAALARQLHMTPAGVARFLGSGSPAITRLLAGLPALAPVFSRVAPGLEHYRPMVQAIQANVHDYAEVDGLPDLRLLTWFLVGPGILLLLISGYGLLATKPGGIHLHLHRPAITH